MKVNKIEFINAVDVIPNYKYTIETVPQTFNSTINENVKENVLGLTIYKEKKKFSELTYKFIKRTIDIIAGLVGTVILIPLTMIVWAINKIYKDDGSIFYVQDRIGENGKIFKMIKFRTMCVDADEKLWKYLDENPEAKKEYLLYKKMKTDPRVTKAGKILRKTSLDEWPQFLSLLTGKMSLIGPRPYLEREKEDMAEYYDIIIQDKPSLTGLWQVSRTF